jgi:exonuclease SbcC
MTPGERQRSLDQLFRLSDYEAAWSNLRSVLRWYESERSSLERDPDVTRLDELTARYNEAVSDWTKKEAELESLRRQLSETEKRLETITSSLKELEEIRRRNEELRKKAAEIQARMAAAEESLRIQRSGIDERMKRIKELRRLAASLRKHEDSCREKLSGIGLPRGLTIEQLKKHAGTLQDQISTALSREEVVRSEIKRASQRISSLAEQSRCPLCLQELSLGYKNGLLRRLYDEISENKKRLRDFEDNVRRLEEAHALVTAVIGELQTIRTRMENLQEQEESERRSLADHQKRLQETAGEISKLRQELSEVHSQMKEFDLLKLEEMQRRRDEVFAEYASLKSRAQSLEAQRQEISKRIEDLKERLEEAERKVSRLEGVKRIIELLKEIRQSYRSIQPRLRREFILYLERTVQRILDELSGADGSAMQIRMDENYTPIVMGEAGYQRSVSNLSGGERTLLAFAYRLGVAQLLMQWRTGHGLRILILDEPTESLGREDGSIDRLADSISRLKTIEQIIAVTHSEEFAEKADHVIWLSKEDNRSVVSS